MEATFIYKGKAIWVEEDMNPLPKKNTFVKIENQKYIITDFSFSNSSVLYIVKIK